MTVIDALKRVLPPPGNPAYAGTPSEWAAVASGLGLSLPTDYKPVPYPIFPEVGGLLPWGSTSNGDVCTWITDQGDPDRRPILIDDGEADWEQLDMTMTAMICAGIREQLDSRLMLFPSPEPELPSLAIHRLTAQLPLVVVRGG